MVNDLMSQVERVIFGKPLKKELWKPGEFKATKFRPKFMKKKRGSS
jgi:hypothetical protein